MADTPQGGLAAVSPAAAMAPIATGNNPMLNQMFQSMLTQQSNRQTYFDQQQKAYNDEMTKYANMVAASQQPENNEAQMWGSMADGASSVAPTWGNLGAMLGKTGAAYGKFREAEQQGNLKSEGSLAALRQAEVRALESNAQQAALMKAMMGGTHIQAMADGTIGVWDKMSGQPIGVYGPKDVKQLTSMTQKFADEIMKGNPQLSPDAAMELGYKKALSYFNQANVSRGNYDTPQVGDVGGMQANPSNPMLPTRGTGTGGKDTAADQIAARIAAGGKETPAITGNVADLLSPEDAAMASRLIARIKANPSAATLDQQRLDTILSRYSDTPKGAGVPIDQAQAKASGMKAIADDHKKMAEDIGGRAQNLQNMSMLLDNVDDDLKSLKPGSPIEPGKLAGFKTNVMSWMKAMGVPLSQEGEDAIANAIALGKTNIKLASADTKAISSRPAVFEFMNMLKANPGPELTVDTIRRLTSQMRNTVATGVQENQDFTQWHKDYPTAPVTDFTNYRNLLVTQPKWWGAFSKKFADANGHSPTYADIKALADAKGMGFSEYVNKMHQAAQGAK